MNPRSSSVRNVGSRFFHDTQRVFGIAKADPVQVGKGGTTREQSRWAKRVFDGQATVKILEVLLIWLTFAAFCGTLPPDVNEAHYLTKAKHFWNPNFCPHDLFLNSSSPHWVFYFVFGWPTLFFSLESIAWMGRAVTWLLLAIAWQRLSWQLSPKVWVAPATAIVFFVLNDRFHLAGEWVIGGFEAKGIAYAFVWFGLARILAQDWNRAWLLLGLATAIHPLAGGWSFLACLAIRLICQFNLWRSSADRKYDQPMMPGKPEKQFNLASEVYWLGGGLLLAMVGAVPSLWTDLGADQELVATAHFIHVQQRLSHHLLFGAFSTSRVALFMLMVAGWFLLFRIGTKKWPRLEPWGMKVLYRLGVIGLSVSLIGLVLSAIAETKSSSAELATSLLRFYWFRFSDFIIPTTLALVIGRFASQSLEQKSRPSSKLALGASIVAIVCAGILLVFQKHADPRPVSDQRSLPKFDSQERNYQAYLNWRKVCSWIAEETPVDAVFITPSEQQTFKWYAGRSEVVNWKDTPQDVQSINEWYRRVSELIVPQKEYELGLMSYSDEQLKEIGSRYQADYLVVLQSHYNRSGSELKRVYPESKDRKTTYVVIEFDQ